jgi:hypothetical protein
MLAFGPPALIGYSDAIESEEPLSFEKSRLTNRSVNSQEVEQRRPPELPQVQAALMQERRDAAFLVPGSGRRKN